MKGSSGYPVQPLRRRRSRLGELTVRIELVVIDSNETASPARSCSADKRPR
jgi:hypothetical protein